LASMKITLDEELQALQVCNHWALFLTVKKLWSYHL